MELQKNLSNKAAAFPEYSYGANKVTLFLKGKRKIKNVILASGREIIKIDGKPLNKIHKLGFVAEDIVDVQSEI